MTPTGRLAQSEPEIQNIPGSFADKLSKAFQGRSAAPRDLDDMGGFIQRLVGGRQPWERIYYDVIYFPADELTYLRFKTKWQEQHIMALSMLHRDYAEVESNHWLDFDPFYLTRKTAEHVTIKVRRK